MTAHLSFWTPIKYGDHAAHIGHHLLEFVDGYFNHRPIVAVVVPGIMQKNSIGVKLQEEIQPLWQTILKIISYATVIIPAILLCVKRILRAVYPFHICSRTLPNGTEETGAFVNGVLQQGVRVEQNKTVYVRPKLALEADAFIDPDNELNLTQTMIDNKPVATPVRNIGNGNYTQCEESAASVVMKMIKEDSRILERVLNQPHQEQFVQEFFENLLSPNENEEIPITDTEFEEPESLFAILEQAVKHAIPINSEIIDELFIRWAGTGCAKLTAILLQLHPGAIRTSPDTSYFSMAAVNGAHEEVEIILKAMREHNISLSYSDSWLHKAYANDCNFSDEEFIALPERMRDEIFAVANVFMSREFLLKIRGYHYPNKVIQPVQKADLFSPNMDAVDVEIAVCDFLHRLRLQQGALLTLEEFQQKDVDRFDKIKSSLESILTSNYLQKTSEQLGLNFIKIPKQLAVFKPQDQSKQTIDIFIRAWPDLSIDSVDLDFYQEAITPSDRKATREEMLNLLSLLEHTGYRFVAYENNIAMGRNSDGEESLYVAYSIYNELWKRPDYSGMNTLTGLMAEEDHAWLKAEIQARQDRFEQHSDVNEEDLEESEASALLYGFNIQRTLKVPIGSIGFA